MNYGEREAFKEVERQLEIHRPLKCFQCHCYMPEGTISLYCIKCSMKKNG